MTATPSPASPLNVFFVVGEESGDQLGAGLMRALKAKLGDAVHFEGVGGSAMAAEGLHSLFPLSDVILMGLVALGTGLPRIVRRMRQTAAAIVAAQPDVLVIIDSPDFSQRVAQWARPATPDMRVINYVSPSVWAWRPWRARTMSNYVDHVLALLPFEPAAHARLGGPPCTFVGHPLAEQISELRPNVEEARRRLVDPPLLLVLPGSRRGEIRRLLAPFGATVERVRERVGALDVVLPTVPHLAQDIRLATAGWSVPPRIVVDGAEKRAAFRIARAALAASGTVTLELGLAGVPTVAAYRVAGVEALIARRLIRVPSVILVNLVLEENIVPEFLQQACTPDRLADALLPLLTDTPERRRQLAAFARLDDVMQIGRGSPSEKAAETIIALAHR